MPTFRIFSFGSGLLVARSSNLFPTIAEYLAHQVANYPDREPIAWEDGNRPAIEGNVQLRYERAAAAVRAGNYFRPDAMAVLEQYAALQGVKLVQRAAEAPPQPVVSAPTRRGKPPNVLVHEFLEETDAAEVSRRAWAATLAACKGV